MCGRSVFSHSTQQLFTNKPTFGGRKKLGCGSYSAAYCQDDLMMLLNEPMSIALTTSAHGQEHSTQPCGLTRRL